MEGKKLFIYSIMNLAILIRLNWTFEFLFLTVGKLHIVAIVWFLMTLFTSVVVFYSTYIWAHNHRFTGVYLSKIKFYIENKN
jgi:hypothetical protein